MKTCHIILTSAMILFVMTVNAQLGINYKAIMNDANGNILANTAVTVQFTILENGSTNVYQETHNPTTDDRGILIINISEGSIISGDFNAIDWGGNSHFLKTEIDIGAGFTDMGTTEFKSVPYALYAKDGTGARELNDLSDAKFDGSSLFVGQGAGEFDEGSVYNTALGHNALYSNTIGSYNTATGTGALVNNTEGIHNTANGVHALRYNTLGNDNTANGFHALYNNTEGIQNTATGTGALESNTLGNNNTANGYYALHGNTDGSQNTANGVRALLSNTNGIQNTATGFNALSSNTTGSFNTAYGLKALFSNTLGNSNTATGHESLFSNTEGHSNVASGYHALHKNTTGVANVAIGISSGRSNTIGTSNVLVGTSAGNQNITGTFNVGIGTRSLENNLNGSFNVAIGYVAGPDSDELTNTGSFGYGATTTASNNFVFGNNHVVGWGFGVAPGSAAIKVGTSSSNGNGATLTTSGVWTDASDRSKKHDIENITYGLNDVMKLRPVIYKLKGLNTQDIGFIAQEIDEVIPEIVFGEEGEKTLSYSHLTSVLTKAIQEQQIIIEELIARIEVLEGQ